ncbi:GntR family transcriptional regulator [Marinobacter sp. AC-23]|uniref:GntR family transcriptional regulator n=1 Tax=Marinobacter sp. AC-23 TaxID=1879031 RepID=UPI001587C32B|nr:GntR family transcriptional regulator [Marinobacter sp. AC-23]
MKEIAYDQLEHLIVHDRLPAGSMVFEVDLAEQLGMGRTPVREALQRLARDGLVVIHPRRGVMVTEMSIARQLELLEVRRPLEQLIATSAARRANAEERNQMLANAKFSEGTAAAGDGDAFFEATRSNHLLLEQAAHNEVVQNVMGLLHGSSRRYWYAHYRQFGDLERAASAHANLLRSIALGTEAEASENANVLVTYLEEFTRATVGAHELRDRCLVAS